MCFLSSKTELKLQPSPKIAVEAQITPKSAQIQPKKHKVAHNVITTPLVLKMANKVAKETGVSPVILGRIILAESGGDPKQISYNKNSYDSGLWQINSVWLPQAKSMGLNLLDPDDNSVFASYLIRHYGLKPWSASKHEWSV